MPPFKIHADHVPTGDQPTAIDHLVEGIRAGEPHITLLGATGTGKTFTIANVVERVQRPTIVIAPNKSLAAQLANEFREAFPENAVEYFVSYYDYYQPEAYVPSTDTYIEKDSSINDEIERLRHSATAALLTRRDVLIVASVSCIYGLGSPEEYEGQILRRDVGLGLVVVVVGDEVLDRVLGEDLAELVGELRPERLVRGDHERRPLHPLDDVRDRERLARAGGAEQRQVRLTALDAFDELVDRAGLVTGRLMVGVDREGGHRPIVGPCEDTAPCARQGSARCWSGR